MSKNKSEIVYVTFIRTTPEKLWAAITQPEFTRQYWGDGANISDWHRGTPWRHSHGVSPETVRVVGEVVESTPPTRLVLTWADPAAPADISRVTYEIEAVEDLAKLTVTHGELAAGSPMVGKVSWGWPRVLSSLKSFLETGQGINVYAGGGGCGSKAA
jgi:uncharacterized protein YndB with AHSA1/START domain